MILTSVTNSTPDLRATRVRASSISASMSAAVAPPVLTMKFACFSEICAPPMRWPFRPQDSIRRAAKSPGGLRNTEPALGSSSGWVAMRFSSRRLISSRACVPSPLGNMNQAATNHSSRASRRATCR